MPAWYQFKSGVGSNPTGAPYGDRSGRMVKYGIQSVCVDLPAETMEDTKHDEGDEGGCQAKRYFFIIV